MGNDNRQQLLEIQKYQERLSRFIGRKIDNNTAASIWIRKYAKIWRMQHQLNLKQYAQ
jgi:hypothetical protein